mmetsp:Transcript_35402/g.105838  ORF Transcript_35402/g.105838 Transcript_35402/m.105838 type:complete len:323 (+) Transcript_35402:329-1297(+)
MTLPDSRIAYIDVSITCLPQMAQRPLAYAHWPQYIALFCCTRSLQILHAFPYGFERMPLRSSLFSPILRSAPPPPPREPPPPRSPKESTAGVPLGEVLEAAGGLVAGRNALNIWMERRGVYELLTTELVGALGGYLRGRLARLGRRLGRRPRLLEAGAADGHLVAHLRASLAGERGEAAVADVFACDDFSTAAPGGVRAARSRGVEQLGYWEALAEHKPDMVVCAWMPMGVDWSHAFRHTPTVREYLLLGEADDGSVGHLWRTWGNPAFRPPTAPPSLPPPYLADGWERADLPEIGRWMLNRFDSDLDPHGSRAVSFVRLNS